MGYAGVLWMRPPAPTHYVFEPPADSSRRRGEKNALNAFVI